MKKYSRLILILMFCIAFTSFSFSQEDRPNIVLIMADDMGYECLSSNGSLTYQTPFIDKLGNQGIKFTAGHSQPLCTPSRVKIMTGRYNYRNYTAFGYLDVNEKTFGNYLKEAGYATCVVGKWQLNGKAMDKSEFSDRPAHFGFDEYCLWNFMESGNRFANPLLHQNGKPLTGLEDAYGPDVVSDYALDFMKRNKDRPFFLYYPMILVHSPFVPTPDSEEWANKEGRSKKDNRYFIDMVAYTDKVVRKLYDQLNELGLLENTIFIFTADNGTHRNIVSQMPEGTFPGGKGTMLTAGTHVPMVMHWPKGGQSGVIYHELIEFSDFLPTFSDAAKIQLTDNAGIDGVSFFNLLAGNNHQPRETIFVHYDPLKGGGKERHYGRFVRDKTFKLYNDGTFFNVDTDFWEKAPIAEKKLIDVEKKLKAAFQNQLDAAPLHTFKQPSAYK